MTVKEPRSAYALRLKQSDTALTPKADRLGNITLMFNDKERALDGDQISAELRTSDQRVIPLTVRAEQGQWVIQPEAMASLPAPIHGLQEVWVDVRTEQDGLNVRRSAKVAFGVGQPTASLADTQLVQGAEPRALVQVDVNTPSRFEARAVLYATNAKGALVPAMETHVAQSLNSGRSELVMPFDGELLAQRGLQAPYALRHLRLFDQKQLALLEQQSAPVRLVDRPLRDDLR
ncbi:DUF4785 family protein [Aestuariibacter halophilus]|uniref:DUF4785 family protein n=1 Tax=Fluctibacter halophilus TaxID=226011 RepID=A0ABS8GBS8_9ALTE|nr:DUF4785 domain-containing protein [Aestuariibacter halophilus]MCC2617997.1 DUF4785 family protein [Aestuariibacter halophilus]